jgi:hypothetical protein
VCKQTNNKRSDNKYLVKAMRIHIFVLANLFFSAGLVLSNPSTAHAQVCHADASPTLALRRFVDTGNGTVADQNTGLMWKKCLEGQMGAKCFGTATALPWELAQQQAYTNNGQRFAGFNDWRLPSRQELLSIVEHQCENPAANLQIFPHTPAAGLWSGDEAGMNAWSLDFTRGKEYKSLKGGGKYIRLVRRLR